VKLTLIPVLICIIVLSLASHTDANAILMSPLKQIKSGIALQDVKCEESFVMVVKVANGDPSCVKPTSTARLLSNGWITLAEFETTHPIIQHNDTLIPQQNITNQNINTTNQIATNATFLTSENNTMLSSKINNATQKINDSNIHNDLVTRLYSNYTSGVKIDGSLIMINDVYVPNRPLYLPSMKPLPEVTSTPIVLSSSMPSVIKILSVGMYPNPLKVGDKPQFTITYQNISNKPITHDLDFDCCWWFGYSIEPSDKVKESTYGENSQKLAWGGEEDLQPNQIVTDPGRGAVSINPSANTGGNGPVHADYTIMKPGMLTVTANIWLAVGSADLYETIQFNVNATQ